MDLEERDAGGKDDFELAQRPRRTSLTVLTPSPVSAAVLWAGTSNGLVQTTRDASQSWQDVTPAGLPKNSEIEAIEASHLRREHRVRGSQCAPGSATLYLPHARRR